jgi:TIR domain
LQDYGVKTWFDVSSLAPGERWQEQIQEALRDSKFFVVIVSPHTGSNAWTFFELGAAVADRKTIIPVMTENAEIERIPTVLRQFQFLRESSPSTTIA